MAKKKSRTPPPPTRVQTPKVHAPRPRARQPGAPRGPRNARLWLLGAGAVVVVAVVAVALATVRGGGGDAKALTAAGCVLQTFPEQGRQHVAELEEGFEYNSFPATSGPHHGQAALWNIYEEPVPELRTVHNLEHGGVVVQYGDQVPQETAGQIRSWYEAGDRNGIVVAPFPALGDKVALTAWTKLATCPGFDEKAFDTFLDLYRYKGPERVPAEAMQQGT